MVLHHIAKDARVIDVPSAMLSIATVCCFVNYADRAAPRPNSELSQLG